MIKFDFFTKEPTQEEFNKFQELYLTKLKLNLGCNTDYRDDYINIDILELENLDVRMDLFNLNKLIPPNSAQEILLYDVVEHFPFTKISQLLSNWISCLAPQGKIIIRVPDLKKISQALLDNILPVFEAQRLIYGGQDYRSNFHMAGFTGDMLEGLLLGSGLSRIIQTVQEPDYNITLVGLK